MKSNSNINQFCLVESKRDALDSGSVWFFHILDNFHKNGAEKFSLEGLKEKVFLILENIYRICTIIALFSIRKLQQIWFKDFSKFQMNSVRSVCLEMLRIFENLDLWCKISEPVWHIEFLCPTNNLIGRHFKENYK